MSCMYCKDEPCTCEFDMECEECRGTGITIDEFDGEEYTCDVCNGTGRRERPTTENEEEEL